MTQRFIQGTMGAPPGNYEMVILQPSLEDQPEILHYWRTNIGDNTLNPEPSRQWSFDSTVIYPTPRYAAAIIQSTFHIDSGPGNFEVLAGFGSELIHLYRDNSNISGGWIGGDIVSKMSNGAASFIQGPFGNAPNFNSEAVVLEDNNLVHYFRHQFPNGTYQWTSAMTISTKATGPGHIIQSTLGPKGNNFEVVVLEGKNIVHYSHDNSLNNPPCPRVDVVTDQATGPASFIQSTFKGTPTSPGNFELVVPEGSNLVHYWRDNSATPPLWHRSAVITTNATGPATIIQSNYGTPNQLGNLEVAALKANGSPYNIVHYTRDSSTLAWKKLEVVTDVAAV